MKKFWTDQILRLVFTSKELHSIGTLIPSEVVCSFIYHHHYATTEAINTKRIIIKKLKALKLNYTRFVVA